MSRSRYPLLVVLSLLGYVLVTHGCASPKPTRPYQEPPPPGIKPTVIAYVDSESFDSYLESALTTQDPVILIQTNRPKPDWEGRLNAWLAAWNMGGAVQGGAGRATVRLQAPFVPKLDGDTVRELRLLIDGLMDRVERLAKERSAWLSEESVKNRRVALLKPYNLRFHLDEAKNIQIIFFNGRYAEQYKQFVANIGDTDAEDCEEWYRGITCSRCKTLKHLGANGARMRGEETDIGPALK
jgi:hypothetical protein